MTAAHGRSSNKATQSSRQRQEHCTKPGYGLVMIHHTTDRLIRQHDQLAAMVIRKFRELDVFVAVNHSAMGQKCYQLSPRPGWAATLPCQAGQERSVRRLPPQRRTQQGPADEREVAVRPLHGPSRRRDRRHRRQAEHSWIHHRRTPRPSMSGRSVASRVRRNDCSPSKSASISPKSSGRRPLSV